MSTPRVLLCVTAYNGRTIVPRALQSAMRIDTSRATVDVLLLDDCSPDLEFSEKVAALCSELGAQYYRSPVNLGIPRNVNLGLLAAVEHDYSHVMICNSDVIFPRNLVSAMLPIADVEGVGSVTAWSNNVSIYSLENDDPDRLLADQEAVDEISAALELEFGTAAMDIPAGISFAIMFRTSVIRDVGIMDPVFGRGYCEELDWSLRSKNAGYRAVLAPGVFVYHSGRGSNLEAGLVSAGSSTVPANEAIIDLRYPQFRSQVAAFVSSDLLPNARRFGALGIMRNAARRDGYDLQVGWLPVGPACESRVTVLIDPDGAGSILSMRYKGFTLDIEITAEPLRDQLRGLFGVDPHRVTVTDGGRAAVALTEGLGRENVNVTGYTTRV